MPIVFYLFLFFIGTSIGSFLNVLIDRLPKEETILGRSHCDYCNHPLSPVDLFPLISYLLLGRRCRYCGKKLSAQYPLVEFITGVLFILSWIYISPAGTGILLKRFVILGIVSCLIVVFVSDAKYRIIPDSVQVALFSFSLFLPFSTEITARLYVDRIIAAFLVMAPILFIHLITQGKGMGFGDVKLTFSIGFLLGILEGFIALYIAFILGAMLGVILIVLKKKNLKSKIAFGPFLVVGVFCILFYKNEFILLIKSMYGL